jgi:tetratricopeptide (TPR) repeat protein
MKKITAILTLLLMTGAFLASAQEDKYGDTEEQQIRCKEALSVYKSFKQQKNFHDAYLAWQGACKECPQDVSESLYVDGVRFIKEELKSTEDKARKQALVDSLWIMYDKRMEIYPATTREPNNRCAILGNKAADYYAIYKNSATRVPEAYEMFRESVDCLKENSAAAVLSGYYLTMFYMFKDGDPANRDQYLSLLLTEYLNLQDYMDASIARETDDKVKEGYDKARNNIDEIFVQIAACGDMVPVLEQKWKADPTNLELSKKIVRLLNKKECTENSLFLPVVEFVHQNEPSAESAYGLGIGYAKAGDYSKALKYFEEAAELCTDCPNKESYLLKAGQTASVIKNTSKARSYANKVLAINPKSGDAYILIGDAVAGSASQCDDGRIGMRAMYLLAADYYAKARNMDSSVADLAGRKIASMAAQFPAKEDIFTVGIKEGDSFTTCTGEQTTIRVRQ